MIRKVLLAIVCCMPIFLMGQFANNNCWDCVTVACPPPPGPVCGGTTLCRQEWFGGWVCINPALDFITVNNTYDTQTISSYGTSTASLIVSWRMCAYTKKCASCTLDPVLGGMVCVVDGVLQAPWGARNYECPVIDCSVST